MLQTRLGDGTELQIREDGRRLKEPWGLQTGLFSPGSGGESSKTTDTLRQTKVARGPVGARGQCYPGRQYRCLQRISRQCEAVRQWGRRARLSPCCQLISPQHSVFN